MAGPRLSPRAFGGGGRAWPVAPCCALPPGAFAAVYLSLFQAGQGVLMRRSPWQTPGRWVLFFTLVGSVGVLGCGGSGSVSGSVTYDGKPLPGGNVAFVSAQGGPTLSATIDSGGNYTIGKIPS